MVSEVNFLELSLEHGQQCYRLVLLVYYSASINKVPYLTFPFLIFFAQLMIKRCAKCKHLAFYC